MGSLNDQERLDLLRVMALSREGDRREGILIRQGRGWFHIAGMGHEALAAIARHLRPQDWIFPHYRDRALVLARGIPNASLARSFYAKKDSSSAGRQLPGHYSSRALNIWSMPSPTGSNLLPAAGAAWAFRLQGLDCVALTCVGDGGMRQGEFYEAVAFALEKSLPVVFVVEDNGFGISTPTLTTNPLRLGLFNRSRIVKADGRDVDCVDAAAAEAIAEVKAGRGPMILWLEMDRLASHSSSDDHRNYRSQEEIERMFAADPVERLATQLISNSALNKDRWDRIKSEIADSVEQEYRFVESLEDPSPADAEEQMLAPAAADCGHDPLFNPGDEPWRMIDAVNRVFRDALARDRKVVFFGEDIEDPMGGVFKLTHGLSRRFPDRVFNSPLAEATILGVGCGLASAGMRPVFELQFIDFVGPAWNQLVNNLATLRWRTNGDWNCPMVIYAPAGAYLPAGGPWHSQSNEAAFAHIPGIRVVCPSTPEDAAGLMYTAMNASDPTVMLLPKHLLRAKRPIDQAVKPIPFGKAQTRRAGHDITVVAWGNCIEKTEEALEDVSDSASVELIDLRSIMPWDHNGVKESVIRTGRLLVVHEDNQSCSVGNTIISEMLADLEVWNAMRAPPRLIARKDVHIGFHPAWEEGSLPTRERIAQAIREMIQGGHPTMRHPVGDRPDPMQPKRNGRAPLLAPAIGEGLEEARVLRFFKNPGDKVQRDEIIYQLETDKAVVDIESPHAGILDSWEAEENACVKIGSVVGYLMTEEEPVFARARPSLPAVPSREAEIVPDPADGQEMSWLANGNISVLTAADSRVYAELKTKGRDQGEYEEIILSAQQQVTATRLARAARIAVPATIFQTISWEPLMATRTRMKKLPGMDHVTTFAILSWLVARVARGHATFRSSLPTNTALRVYKNVHLGVAVALPTDDLTTAIIENADQFSLREFANRLRERVDLARSGVDQAGRQPATLILTSVTQFDIPCAVPVIVPPAAATLLIGAPRQRVRLDNESPREVPEVDLSLTFDHRVMNGAAAGRFLNEVKQSLENPQLPEEAGPV